MILRLKFLLISFGLTIALFFVAEGLIRWLMPQHWQLNATGGRLLTADDPMIGGGLLRPHAHAVHRTPEFEAEYRVNPEGLRDEVRPQVNKGDEIRILALGDSFTFGIGNPYENIWPAVFEKKLMNEGYTVRVIKAGILGFNTRKELFYLKRLLPRYRPHYVILGFVAHDLFENTALSEGVEEEGIMVRELPYTRWHTLRFFRRVLFSSDHLYGMVYLSTPRREYFTRPLSARVEERVRITKELISEMHAFSEKNGARFIVLSIPQQFQIIASSHESFFSGVDHGWIDRVFGAFVAGKGIPWLATKDTLEKEYREKKTPVYYRVDGHLNPAGHEAVAKHLLDHFMKLHGSPGPR